jgi:hypothetical protein
MGSRSRSRCTAATRPRLFRRSLLAFLSLGLVGSPYLSSGCVAGFDPPSELHGLRVIAVTADKPYANPGNTVTFKMTYQDTPSSPDDAPRHLQIVWLGPCIDPEGDDYYGCYPQFPALLKSAQFGIDLDEFTVELPDDIVTRRPRPASGPHYGLAYVFFAACAGTLRPVIDEGTGRAGSFPIGCFDKDGQRLGADSFVPGYTQVYVFADGRTNANPAILGLTLDGKELPEEEDPKKLRTEETCPLTEDERSATGCEAKDPFSECKAHELKVVVDPSNVAETDPDAKGLKEVVWVNYLADQGDLDRGIKLVSDATKGYVDEHEVKWIPPPKTSVVTLWAVVRDARGGSSVVKRLVRVE